MKHHLAHWLESKSQTDSFAFLTGDLGFQTFETLRDRLGPFFINTGISEQHMVGLAAGIAKEGIPTWIYSIAPFCYARPFEQVRNDLCLTPLPVRIVGNGGGYAYGPMGATHHALEDYGVLLTLPHMRIFVPAFNQDMPPILTTLSQLESPAYLRLGIDTFNNPVDTGYAPWRQVLAGTSKVILTIGPLVGNLLNTWGSEPLAKRPSIWLVSELPIDYATIPPLFLKQVTTQGIHVLEEHVKQGGLAQMLALIFLQNNIHPPCFKAINAHHKSPNYCGSQNYHRLQDCLILDR